MQIHELSAVALTDALRSGGLSAREVMQAFLTRIDALNPRYNAIVSLIPPEEALAQADAADRYAQTCRQRGESLPILHGVPLAMKDLVRTKGLRTTWGSPIFAEYIPSEDDLVAARLRQAGAILIGKTNTPEFGAGSQTFNAVFGVTPNPYDLGKTCGGSSGGAAVALATRMLPLADGSDLGGSLRNPAAFCNVLGFRPSPGRVPSWPDDSAWDPLAVLGPMARSVPDLALLLSAMAGPAPQVPLALDDAGATFRRPLARSFEGVRVACSPDLGRYPVQTAIREAFAAALPAVEALGCRVEEAHPDLHDADAVFGALRAYRFARIHGTMLREHRQQMKATVIWNIEAGLALSGAEIMHAEVARTALYRRMLRFMEDYEFLLLPATQVLPFSLEEEYPRAIEGQALASYISWMGLCCAITLTALPAVSVPIGFSAEGLPVGMQIVGRPRADFAVLQLANAFTEANPWTQKRPPPAC